MDAGTVVLIVVLALLLAGPVGRAGGAGTLTGDSDEPDA